MATTAPAEQAPAAGGSKKKLIILIVVGALILLGGGIGGTMFLMKGKESKEASAKNKKAKAGDGEEATSEDEADAEGEHTEEGDAEAEGEGEGEEAAKGEGEGKEGAKSAYVELSPPFVVNFQDDKKRARFLKAEISIMAKAPAVQEAITQNLPAVRNAMVMLLSRQVYEQLMTPEGKEKLRTDALEEVKAVLTKVAGAKKAKGVKDLFFSSLVMQ
ncbi:MAG: flagellar basal body-associated FliL family protein [Gammaproteobacteria bacterium]|nr:flagellar basal body-associated FliL family protein [Gammaproteobacteria bacterium]